MSLKIQTLSPIQSTHNYHRHSRQRLWCTLFRFQQNVRLWTCLVCEIYSELELVHSFWIFHTNNFPTVLFRMPILLGYFTNRSQPPSPGSVPCWTYDHSEWKRANHRSDCDRRQSHRRRTSACVDPESCGDRESCAQGAEEQETSTRSSSCYRRTGRSHSHRQWRGRASAMALPRHHPNITLKPFSWN